MPSPADAIEADRHEWSVRPFTTLPGQHVPLSTTDYVSIDQGFLVRIWASAHMSLIEPLDRQLVTEIRSSLRLESSKQL